MQTPHTAPSVRYPGYVLAYGVHHDGDTEFDMDRPFLRKMFITPRGPRLNKKPAEVHIGNGWLYDVVQAMKTATTESWGVTEEMRGTMTTELGRAPTQREVRRRAVDLHKLNVRRWIDDSWNYVFVNVRVSTFPDGVPPTAEDLSAFAVLGGIEYGITGYGEATEDESVQTLGDEMIEAHLARMAAATQAEEVRREAVARTRAAMKPATVQQLGLYLDIPDDAAVRDDGWVQAWVGVQVPEAGGDMSALSEITTPSPKPAVDAPIAALLAAADGLSMLVTHPHFAGHAEQVRATALRVAQAAKSLAVRAEMTAFATGADPSELVELVELTTRCETMSDSFFTSTWGGQ